MNFHSLDTETLNRENGGYVVLLGFMDYGTPKFLEFPDNFKSIFDFLEGRKYTAFNMNFDAKAILHKNFLPIKILTQIGMIGWVIYGGYEFEFIPQKILRVRHIKTKKKFEIYDIKQFFDLSLKAAAKEFLPSFNQKKEIPNSWYSQMDMCLVDRRRETILDYFFQDLKTTQGLTDLLLNSYLKIGIKPKDLFSAGYLAFIKYKDIYLREKISDDRNNYWKRGFFGGRIEIFKMGNQGNISLYDIHSAYPSIIKDLKSTHGVEISSGKEWAWKGECYGIYYISVNCDPNKFKIGPLAFRDKKGFIFYPTGKFKTYCGNYAIKTLREFKIPFEVIEAREIFPDNDSPLFNDIDQLFLKRKISGFNIACKKTLNSIYGKFCEKGRYNQKMAQILAGRKLFKSPQLYGRGTNYILASHITEKIRISLWKTTQAVGESNIIAMATDGLFIKKGIELKTSDKIGQWGKSELKKFMIFGCGRYLWEDIKTKEIKSKFRGTALGPEIIRKMRHTNKRFFKIPRLHTKTLRRWADNPDNDLNVLNLEEKIFEIEDNKRIWGELPTFAGCFKKSVDSLPIILK